MSLPFSVRSALLACCCCAFTSCGTANHFLNQANGMVRSLTSPARGILRLSSDTPAEPAPDSATPSAPRHDSGSHPTKRPD